MMKLRTLAAVSALATAALVASVGAADPGIAFVGIGFINGGGLDKSGLAGQPICRIEDPDDCIDQATLGGLGSALAYTGFDSVFLAVPDRGPFDGRTDVPYRDRFNFLHLALRPSATPSEASPNIVATLLDTRFLKAPGNTDLVGSSADFAHRFDPEGVAVGRGGTFFISDEYGPFINEFNRQGHLVRQIAVPARFSIENPSGDIDSAGNSLELYPALNTSGRQANRGMEGLAISPDGRYLFGLMQNALIQDNGLNAATPPGRVGLNSRLLKVDLQTGATQEFVYTVDAIGNGRGQNDIAAINDHQFLVVERDNRSQRPTPPNANQAPIAKRIYKIDINGATDVSAIESLPAGGGAVLTAAGITPVTKTLFIDLLDASYKVGPTATVASMIAEKIEGMAWGPDLSDGRHVLYVISDNDLYPGRPTQVFAFAVNEAAAGIHLDRQQLSDPLFPPGQVKKALK